MTLKLYDTMAREKRDFAPADPKRVTMYVCGPTVYNFAHVGNFRPVVVFDVLYRLLRFTYGEEAVLYAANVTDVDDKINAKAAEEGVPIDTITDRYLEAYNGDAAKLGALRPTFQPRATRTMDQIIDMIGRLVRNNAAYAAEGHVLFNTRAYAEYGKLSGRPLEEMIAGARVDVAPYKQNPADFVLWKPSKPGEPVWESPWGPGRPGWHIECSAMIEQTLGLPIDIHGGGIDLVFPHHENERAQGVCATHDHTYSRFWLHNGFLNFGEEKMSKSLGNVALAHELLEQYKGEVIRWALLSAHYRQPLEWNAEVLAQAKNSLDRLYQVLRDAKPFPEEDGAKLYAESEAFRVFVDEQALGVIENILGDDLNTPSTFSYLFQFSDRLRSALSDSDSENRQWHVQLERMALLKVARLMGFLEWDPDDWFKGEVPPERSRIVEDLLRQRAEARDLRNWSRADELRDQLKAMWVDVADARGQVSWRMVSEETEIEAAAIKAFASEFNAEIVSAQPALQGADFLCRLPGGNIAVVEVKRSARDIHRVMERLNATVEGLTGQFGERLLPVIAIATIKDDRRTIWNAYQRAMEGGRMADLAVFNGAGRIEDTTLNV